MSLTPQQKATLKAAILAAGGDITAAYNAGASGQVADLCNAPTNPVVRVWRTDTPSGDILDAIDWTRYTPNTVPSGADTPAVAALFLNRAMLIQTKQMNLQTMTRREAIDCSKAGARNGLSDAVVNIPAGNNGALVSAGGSNPDQWGNVAAVCQRTATFAEAALKAAQDATTNGQTASRMVFEGQITTADIDSL